MRAYHSVLLLCLVLLPLILTSATFAQAPVEPDAAAVLARANEELKLQHFDLVVSSFTRVITLTPNDATAYCGRGTAYANLGKQVASAVPVG